MNPSDRAPTNPASVVERYYDEWTQRYLDVDDAKLIEACRPAKAEDLLAYYIDSIGLQHGMHLLDAGCGVGGPAIHFARQLEVSVEGLTISQVQVDMARRLVTEAGVADRVLIRKGDFRDLATLYPAASFHGALFLESLGHAQSPEAVIQAVWSVLRPGGFLYIKDFFIRETDDPETRQRIADVTRNIDASYAYNTLDLHRVLRAARKVGFQIASIHPPGFDIDIRVRAQFESRHGINIFGPHPEFIPTDWLELKFIKNEGYNVNLTARLDLEAGGL